MQDLTKQPKDLPRGGRFAHSPCNTTLSKKKNKREPTLQQIGHTPQIFILNLTIAVEGLATLYMAGHLADEIWIVSKTISNTDEGTSSHVTAYNVTNRGGIRIAT